MTDKVPSQRDLPFLAELAAELGIETHEIEPSLVVLDPPHMARGADPPQVRIRKPGREVASYRLALSLGGSYARQGPSTGPAEPLEELRVVALDAEALDDGTLALRIPDEVWAALQTNFGYWWTVVALVGGEHHGALRTSELRCLIRDEPIARIEGSSLAYRDEGHLPVVDLGGDRQHGWSREGKQPPRPGVRKRTSGPWSGSARATRHRKRKRTAKQGSPGARKGG